MVTNSERQVPHVARLMVTWEYLIASNYSQVSRRFLVFDRAMSSVFMFLSAGASASAEELRGCLGTKKSSEQTIDFVLEKHHRRMARLAVAQEHFFVLSTDMGHQLIRALVEQERHALALHGRLQKTGVPRSFALKCETLEVVQMARLETLADCAFRLAKKDGEVELGCSTRSSTG